MNQHFDQYSPRDHQTWGTLFTRQTLNLQDKACRHYLDCLETLTPDLQARQIPRFTGLDQRLKEATGWSIEVVPGLIPVGEFFDLLSRRRFCSSTWIRSPKQLDYLEEPDMFHDIYGHVPLLMHSEYARFMERFGQIGKAFAGHPEAESQLERLYWFTIEFGLILEDGAPKILGAGILSSYGESVQIFNSPIEVRPFHIDEVLSHSFRKDVMQTTYYALESIDQLADSLDRVEQRLALVCAAV